MRMKGFTRGPLRASRLAAVMAAASLAAAAAQPACSPLEPCRADAAAAPAGPGAAAAPLRAAAARELAELPAPFDALAGGGRSVAMGHVALPAAAVAWSGSMDRHDLIVGAIDPDHDDG